MKIAVSNTLGYFSNVLVKNIYIYDIEFGSSCYKTFFHITVALAK